MYKAILSLGLGFAQALSPLVNLPMIKSQAASLAWGGLYDIKKDWKKPHCGHRDGNTIDLSLSNLTNYEKKLLDTIARKRGFDFYRSESASNPLADHWHATLANESN
ncbi:hypothetical protein D3C87_1235870 [compost metagenome]